MAERSARDGGDSFIRRSDGVPPSSATISLRPLLGIRQGIRALYILARIHDLGVDPAVYQELRDFCVPALNGGE